MKERPINLKAWEVRAILDGRKTQFRRAVKPQPVKGGTIEELASGLGVWKCEVEVIPHRPGVDSRFVGQIGCEDIRCPYGQPGDRLWVREASAMDSGDGRILYRADGDDITASHDGRWIPSIHMRRESSRITLEVESVRVERLNEVSEDDAKAEGICQFQIGGIKAYGLNEADRDSMHATAKDAYRSLCQSINGPGSWAANPWAWAVTFRRV